MHDHHIEAPSDHDADRGIEAGFTLVELLIVIVIMGILAGIVVFAVGNLTDDAAKNACKSEVRMVESAVEAWKAHEGNAGEPALADLQDAPNGGTLKDAPSRLGAGADQFQYANGVVTPGADCQ